MTVYRCGKTTLARLLATTVDAIFKELSATNSGTSDVKAIFDEAKRTLKLTGKRTILFMDEIQRFNKAQQVRRVLLRCPRFKH
jgi:putative ATPase